ncbi:MAG: hypothetical protein GWN18_15240 [Thermoplasmata archaeon]|nr:hypothetical protein [Thermoplasmata archaeon]NIW83876.1 hypothetical protein [Thermoplasmata archaeon]
MLVMAMAFAPSTAMPPQPGASGLSDSCQRCHVNGTPSSEAGASLSIEDVPHRYDPGRKYNIVVELDRGQGPRPHFDILHAFQLGVDGGTLEILNGSFVIISETEVASRGASTATSWQVVWTAPPEGDAHFFAEAVVADGDGTEEGDVRLEAQALSYGPLDVLPEEPPGPFDGTLYIVVLAILASVVVAAALLLTHHREPPREMD